VIGQILAALDYNDAVSVLAVEPSTAAALAAGMLTRALLRRVILVDGSRPGSNRRMQPWSGSLRKWAPSQQALHQALRRDVHLHERLLLVLDVGRAGLLSASGGAPLVREVPMIDFSDGPVPHLVALSSNDGEHA